MALFNDYWENTIKLCKGLYGIDVGKNARFVAENIFLKSFCKTFFVYVECGVYRGTTFFPIYHFMSQVFEAFFAYAIDSFNGFPSDVLLHSNDHFERFESLYNEGRISKYHLMCATDRQYDLVNNEHQSRKYFNNCKLLFASRCRDKPEISIIETPFSLLRSNFNDPPKQFDLVFLDCDLYLSYKQCLSFFKDKTDIFIADEYFSLKYPGARVACDEFVQENSGWKLFGKTETNPYFERWSIKKVSS